MEGHVNDGQFRGSTAHITGGATVGGDVVIGSSIANPLSPGAHRRRLAVAGTQDTEGYVGMIREGPEGSTNGTIGRLVFGFMNGGETLAGYSQIESELDGAPDSTLLKLQTMSKGEIREHLRVTREGRVGIGTGSPLAKLHVAGDLRVDGGAGIAGPVGIATSNPATDLQVGAAPLQMTTPFVGGRGVAITTPADDARLTIEGGTQVTVYLVDRGADAG